MAYWKDLSLIEQPIGGFRGLYEAVSPIERPLGALSAVSNLIISPAPALATRPGLTLVGAQVGVSPVHGIHPYYNTVSGAAQLLAQFGTALHKLDEAGNTWGASIGALADAKSTSAMLNDLLIIFDGTNKKKWDGTALASLGGSPPAGKYVVAAYEQLYVAGMADRPADVDFCDIALPEVWTPAPDNDAGSISVGAREGDYITWLGFDKVQGKVIIWTRYGVVVLNGPETPNRPGLWSVRTASAYGTPNGRTVQNIDGTWMWLTDRGFAIWDGGGIRVEVDSFKDTFNTIDWANIANAGSWIDMDNRYWCAVPVTGGGLKYFCYDKQYGWFTGTGKIHRVYGSYRFSGREIPLVGDSTGSVYKVMGDSDAGTAIAWSAVIGPSMLGASAYKKELLRVDAVLSLATGATASAAMSASDTGAFGAAKSITAGAGVTQAELNLPFAAGENIRSGLFRLQLSGTGKAVLHDLVLMYRKAGK